ncbi:unnamed protein product [Candidula unifasciata]|uniref:Uncharacterized protein n=1 Tax=Candidula unifasciata TaxID=100452 RepID=A0A8S4A0S5_9EUPU|nr:unnamed protein product [Candidula unifasciata]
MDKHSLGHLGLCVIDLVLLMSLAKGTWSECAENRAESYVAVSEASYDRNYSSITSEGKQPLGFHKAIWHFNQPDTTPCISITGANSRRLEIMFESVPPSRLCMKLTGAPLQCSDSGTGQLYLCPRATEKTVYVEFTCDSQCSENDVQFWYRLVLGAAPDEDPEDHWCQQRNREYPENLKQLPPGVPINTHTEKPGDMACNHAVSLSLMLIIILFHFC